MARGARIGNSIGLGLGNGILGLLAAGLGAASLVAGPAYAQAVVQPVPGAGTQSLNAALSRLARDPRDLTALIDAGTAALALGDVDAAIGFFDRADQLSPNNVRVKAGLAGALVRSENPFDAIPLFAEAERAGALDGMLLADRGLAYDLVGDNANAQRYYRQSLQNGSSDETLRRLALSQAIAGDRAGMEATLSPLLQRQDKAAWRARAFALAILGRTEEAVAIANQTMPAELAGGIAPYLRYMPRLTAAQKAAAANFGRFPRASEIGRDDPRVAHYAPQTQLATADARLVPAGEPLGRGRSRRDARRGQPVAAAAPAIAPRSAPPEPMPVREISPPPQLALAPTPARPQPIAAPQSAPAARMSEARVAAAVPTPAAPVSARATFSGVAPATVSPIAKPASPVGTRAAASALPPTPVTASTAPVAAAPAAAPASGPELTAAGFDLARVVPSPSPAAVSPTPAEPVLPPPVRPAVAAAPAPAPAAVVRAPAAPAGQRPRRVADAFADLAAVSTRAVPDPGAVDVRRIAAARPKPEATREPPKPVHPSRIWVQVGTGRDTKALAFTWRALGKGNPDLFKGRSAWVSDWGRTNRLLTGPFATEAAAKAFLGRLKKKDVDAFLWTSPAGQVVDDLPGA